MAFQSPNRQRQAVQRKTLVLCFDGTGNKFQGTAGDSNVIKIFSCLDREAPDQHHYYQPGIGTYTTDGGLSHTSRFARIRSWVEKAKASAVGTGFEDHVMGGYKFLMRYYKPGDDVYFFGFSRGAYTARFLAQMLDYVGLLAPGNEELLRFAWKTFARWQQCTDATAEERKNKKETYEFMKKFRQTFSVPVRRLRFLGLFDTVNSVAAFEGAFLQRRTKFPYTAKSSAKVIRHAVSIDERRAKFRQDLLGQKKPGEHHHHHMHQHLHDWAEQLEEHLHSDNEEEKDEKNVKGQPPSNSEPKPKPKPTEPKAPEPEVNDRFQPRKSVYGQNLGLPNPRGPTARSSVSSLDALHKVDEDQDGVDDNATQDIQEVWFPGCHADIGGGWPLEKDEEVALSHSPLVWMIREAWRAGLPFDIEALRENNFLIDEEIPGRNPRPAEPRAPVPQLNHKPSDGFHDAKESQTPALYASTDGTASNPAIPVLEVDGHVVEESSSGDVGKGPAPAPDDAPSPHAARRHQFLQTHAKGSTQGRMHDVLQRNNGVPAGSVLSWNIMEWLPFRRMDLNPDGSWDAIRWPLPRGETRDIPADAWIHGSAIRRMEGDRAYRPGNLIVGGGGRGMRQAPPEAGMGKWKVLRDDGDAVGEIVVRAVEAGNVRALTG